MGRVNALLHSMNVGVVDKKHLARVDLERMRLAAETQTNLLPLTTGPAFMRPGLEYISTSDSNDVCRLKEFVFGATDAALMEFTDYLFRVRVDDVLVTRPTVTATVGQGAFSSDASWTKTASSGATVTISGGYLNLTASALGSRASATQTITVNETGVEHALRIVIERGPVKLRVGSTSGGDEYIAETTLRTGTHSLAFTPTGNFYIEFFSTESSLKRVDSCTVEGAGVMTLPTIWPEASLDLMRFAQSADVVFVACSGLRPQRIERRSNRSWSVVRYQPSNGPFTALATRNVKMKPSVTIGNGTLTASAAFFNANHVGTLFYLSQEGINQTYTMAAESVFSDVFRVTGLTVGSNDERDYSYTVSGTWSGTLTTQRSVDAEDFGFHDFPRAGGTSSSAITANGSYGNAESDDNSDNMITYHRIGFKSGGYTSGVATVVVASSHGHGNGICRVTAVNSATEAAIEVVDRFQTTSYTDDWRECEWSDTQTWPSAVVFAEGRLWWSGQDRIWGSVSDDFENFDDSVEGDSGPISRSIATGGVNDTQWMMGLQRLLIGTEGAIATCKSSSLDEPLSPTNLSIKDSSSTGAAPVDPVKVDTRGLFVERAGKSLMELSFDGTSGDYNATQLSKLATDVFDAGVRTVAVQRRPDTRIWLVMNDGTCVCVVYEPLEEVLAFIPVVTDGEFESVAVIPAANQDRVYFSVKRTINSGTVRYIEKMAKDSEVTPSTLCKVMDSFKTASPGGTSVTGATHLVGESVVVWADGEPLTETIDGYEVPLTFTVDGSGNFTLPASATSIVYGLPYTVRFKSGRLAYGAEAGTAMLQKKKVNGVGLIMTDFVRAGIRYGSRFDDATRAMYPLPANKDGATADPIVLSEVDDEETFTFPGEWSTDSRVCLEWASPFTATILGMVLQVETNG